jgi:uncharacterized protein YbjQ (UPF0145 family)
MKMSVKTAGFTALFVSLSLCAISVHARDTAHRFPIKDAIAMAKANGLDDDIKFYFGNQKHPAVNATLVKGVVSNKKTNASNKTDEEACQWVMLSALLQLQKRARDEGGNAVINIESYYKKNAFKSNDQFECHTGTFLAGVALRGDVVKLK